MRDKKTEKSKRANCFCFAKWILLVQICLKTFSRVRLSGHRAKIFKTTKEQMFLSQHLISWMVIVLSMAPLYSSSARGALSIPFSVAISRAHYFVFCSSTPSKVDLSKTNSLSSRMNDPWNKRCLTLNKPGKNENNFLRTFWCLMDMRYCHLISFGKSLFHISTWLLATCAFTFKMGQKPSSSVLSVSYEIN